VRYQDYVSEDRYTPNYPGLAWAPLAEVQHRDSISVNAFARPPNRRRECSTLLHLAFPKLERFFTLSSPFKLLFSTFVWQVRTLRPPYSAPKRTKSRSWPARLLNPEPHTPSTSNNMATQAHTTGIDGQAEELRRRNINGQTAAPVVAQAPAAEKPKEKVGNS
jgi:hypothetical protein